jgi:MraZ protein
MPAEQNLAPIFSGEFCHGLDSKNRITIPSRWRTGEADEFFLSADASGRFLKVMPTAEFRAVADRVAAVPGLNAQQRQVFLRQFYSRSKQAVADKQGRLVIPVEFCDSLNLRGEIFLVGVHTTFELWNREAWEATKREDATTFDAVANLIGL